ncbi:GMC oxidoreductase [Streptomyces sp. NPDC052092]|uniref:GMC oxidoreductase n=1 Tax=Streptomyces sp. NPDC052092 TaxID=3365685 RepID=UPI0037CDFBCB
MARSSACCAAGPSWTGRTCRSSSSTSPCPIRLPRWPTASPSVSPPCGRSAAAACASPPPTRTRPPVLDPNYFGEEEDVRAVLSGIATARRIAWSSALAEWGIEEVGPGLDAVDDQSIGDYAKKHFGSYCHPVGTCAMGEDEVSVVDSELRVRGLDGLRVADASVIPSIPSNNTNATVYAIAERAADLLRRR